MRSPVWVSMSRTRIIGCAITVATLLLGSVSSASAQDASPGLGGDGSPATDSVAAAPTLAPLPLIDRIEAEIPVEGSPDWPTAAFGSIWVLAPDLPLHGTGTPNLVRIDPATNEVVATIELPDRLCQGFVATDDAIWVCAVDALVRVDPDTDTITSSVPIELAGGFYRLAYGGGMVWALANGSFAGDTVIGLDPVTGTTASFPVGGSVGGMTYAFDALWLTLPDQGSVVRLDRATGETRELVAGLPVPTQIVAGQDDLWVSLYGGPASYSNDEERPGPGDAQLVRIDSASGEVVAELAIGEAPRGGLDLWADGSSILVRGTRPWLARVDEATSTVVESIASEPEVHAINGPLTVAFGSVWTVNIEEPAVYRLTP